MKTAITSSGNETTSLFDLRFGRAHSFCIYDDQTGDVSFIENANMNAQGGAGTKSAEKMMELGVQKVISGDFGPKAKTLLDKFQIQMVIINDENKTIGDILKTLKS
jgi:predicted Fe-Mo cluster-binding NifX family protein